MKPAAKVNADGEGDKESVTWPNGQGIPRQFEAHVRAALDDGRINSGFPDKREFLGAGLLKAQGWLNETLRLGGEVPVCRARNTKNIVFT
jgi:hypothetical protein